MANDLEILAQENKKMKRELADMRRTGSSNLAMRQGPGGIQVMPHTMADMLSFASLMAQSERAIPVHLRNNPGACLAVAMQAMDWGMNPYSVAQKSYVANINGDGPVAYEAQLIMAVINSRAPIKGRLKLDYSYYQGDFTPLNMNAYGKPNRVPPNEADMRLICTASGVIDGETYALTTPPLGQISPRNSPLWQSDPRQQIAYYTSRAWARRFCPEVILGVYDREEAQAMADEQAANAAPSKNPLEITADEADADDDEAGMEASLGGTDNTQQSASVLLGDAAAAGAGEASAPAADKAELDLAPPPAVAAARKPSDSDVVQAMGEQMLDFLDFPANTAAQIRAEAERLKELYLPLAKTKNGRERVNIIAAQAELAAKGADTAEVEQHIRGAMDI